MKQELKVGVKILGNEMILPMSYEKVDKSEFAKTIITKNNLYFNDFILSNTQKITIKELNKILLNLNDIILNSPREDLPDLEIIFNQIKNILEEIKFADLYYIKQIIDTTTITKAKTNYEFCDIKIQSMLNKMSEETLEFLKLEMNSLSYEQYYKNLEYTYFINYDFDNECYISTPRNIFEGPFILLDKDDFFYSGYCFSPYEKLKSKRMNNINEKIETDNNLGLCTYDWKKRNYTYNSFYEAANHSDCDLFICKENNKTYIPGDNELFLYKV